MTLKIRSNILSVFLIISAIVLSFGPARAEETLKVVDKENVCMVTDMHFGKKQIPVDHKGQTYFGCCENCKETLSKDAKSRFATDPLTGRSVDKAKATIAMRSDSSVLYFESKKTFEQYSKKSITPSKSKKR